MALRRTLPGLLLLAYGIAFGIAAFGVSTPAFDDHPGQVYRLWHALTHGLAPPTWNPGWWAGYPELQFYPPGFFYLGALVRWASIGALSVSQTYSVLLWLCWLLPGVAAWLALVLLLGSGWLALPGAFVALTLSAGVTSGVEGGVHWGMLPARLGWALLPLLLVAVDRCLARDRGPAWPMAVLAPLLAAVVLTHPAHAPAAVVLVLLWAGTVMARLASAVGALGFAVSLTAFWTVPLVARLEHTRPLAWGHLEIPPALLPVALIVLAALARRVRRSPHAMAAGGPRPVTAVLAAWPWAMAAVVLADALAMEPLGVRWLPADRVADGAWMAVVLAAGFTGGRMLERFASRRAWPVPAIALAATAVTAVASLHGHALTLWPRASAWPSYEATARGLRLDDLWTAVRQAPAGRVLFIRSGVPLVFGNEWWRPHSHVTALAPIYTGRGIVNGTFTHPSPVAAFLYRGSAGPGPITALVERLDGHSLFGVPLEALDPGTLTTGSDRLGISAIVALDEDVPRLRALEGHPDFVRARAVGPFVVFERRHAVALPERLDDVRWRLDATAEPGTWVTTRMTYYPLWRAERDGRALDTRPGPAWDLEVRLDGGHGPVDLVYTAGGLESTAALVSVVAVVAWLGWGWRAWRAATP